MARGLGPCLNSSAPIIIGIGPIDNIDTNTGADPEKIEEGFTGWDQGNI